MTKTLTGWRYWLSFLLFLALPAAGAEQVTVERDTALYSEPRTDASQVGQLKQGSVAEVLSRNGAWLNIKTPAATGWTFTFNVRFPSQSAGQSGGGSGSALGRLFAPRSTSVATTSTIGIRGLDETDLRQATFSPDQMRLLDEYAANREAAQSQANEAGLAPARLDYFGGRAQ
jgi:hypothetical protein